MRCVYLQSGPNKYKLILYLIMNLNEKKKIIYLFIIIFKSLLYYKCLYLLSSTIYFFH